MTPIGEIYAQPFMRDALLAACLAGAMLGYLGIFIVLRRTVFLGAALPQFAALGIAASLMFGFAPIAGALAAVFIGTSILSLVPSRSRIPADGAVGIAFAFAASVAILFLSRSAEGEAHVFTILSGDILGITSDELTMMAAVFGVSAIVHGVCWKEFVYVSYDSEMAATMGLRVRLWDGLLFLTIGTCVALALQVSGAVVSFGFLVGPATAALLCSRKLSVIILLTIVFGVCSAAAGLTLSFQYELPSGPMIAACALAPLLPATIWNLIRR